MTIEEKATNADTSRHIRTVVRLLHLAVKELLDRADAHDQSKLQPPELAYFTEYTDKLKGCTYGSAEYESYLKAMAPALEHHYARNAHHPEHYQNGVWDMNLFDLIEMFCDWKAATLRHDNGNLRKSIAHNAKRFNIEAQLTRILENTVDLVDHVHENA